MAMAAACHSEAERGPGLRSSFLSAERERRGREAWLGFAEEKASLRIRVCVCVCVCVCVNH